MSETPLHSTPSEAIIPTSAAGRPETPPVHVDQFVPFVVTDSILCQSPPDGMPSEIGGQPVFYYWREVARVGKYTKPKTGQKLDIDTARLNHWVGTAKEFLADGNSIPFNCDHSLSAGNGLGYITELKTDGTSLFALEQIIGDESAKIAAANKVSIGVAETFTDSKQRQWSDVIYHISAVQIPLIYGLDQQTIAASLSDAGVAGEIILPSAEGTTHMSEMMNMPMHSSHYDMLCSMVPGLDKIPRDQQMAHAIGHLKACAGGARGLYSADPAVSGVVEASGDPANPEAQKPTFVIPTAEDADDAFDAINAKLASAPILSGDEEGRTVLASLLTVDAKGNVSIGMAKRPGVKRLSTQIADAIAAIALPENTTNTIHAGLFARSTGGRTAGQGSTVPKEQSAAAENQKVYDAVLADQQKRALDEANSLRRLRNLPAIG